MKNIYWWLVGIVFGLSILGVYLYINIKCGSSTCLQNLISNLISSALAIVAGIPIALWIDRRIKDQENIDTFNKNRKKEVEILKLVKEELDFSLNSLFLKGKKGNTNSLITQPLKSDLWDSLINSTNINNIEDSNLLNRIISAYYVLRIIKNIESQAYIALRSATVNFTLNDGTHKNGTQLLLEDARSFDNLFESSVNEALEAITVRLNEILKYGQ